MFLVGSQGALHLQALCQCLEAFAPTLVSPFPVEVSAASLLLLKAGSGTTSCPRGRVSEPRLDLLFHLYLSQCGFHAQAMVTDEGLGNVLSPFSVCSEKAHGAGEPGEQSPICYFHLQRAHGAG